MSSSTPIRTDHPSAASAAPTAPSERSHLLSWHRHGDSSSVQEAGTATAVATAPDQHRSFFHHIAPFARVTHNEPVAEAHARHFWHIDRPRLHSAHPYTPGIADALRLKSLTFSTEAVIGVFAMAGFMDALFPHGNTVFNPSGTRNEFAAITCLLGCYIALNSVAPALAGNLYGAMIKGCNGVGEQLHHHSVTTRMVGFVTASAFAVGGIAGSVVLSKNAHPGSPSIPEHGWSATIYDKAGVLALAASVPGLAAIGWYLGRMGSAAMHKRT